MSEKTKMMVPEIDQPRYININRVENTPKENKRTRNEPPIPKTERPMMWGIHLDKVLPFERELLAGLDVRISPHTVREGDGEKWPASRNYRLPAYYADFEPMPMETWFELVYRLEKAWNAFCRKYNNGNTNPVRMSYHKCWMHEWGDAPASVFTECPPTGFTGDIKYQNGTEKALYTEDRITSGSIHGVDEPRNDYYLRMCTNCGAINVKEGVIKMIFVWGGGNYKLNKQYRQWKKRRYTTHLIEDRW